MSKKDQSFEILNKVESTVTEVVYTLQDEVSAFYYKEFLNDKGKVIDCELKDKDGGVIDDEDLMLRVQEFVDAQI